MDTERRKEKETDGATFDIRPGQYTKMQMHKITMRVTKDETGRTLSLADELRGIMLLVPCEPIMDLLEWLVEARDE